MSYGYNRSINEEELTRTLDSWIEERNRIQQRSSGFYESEYSSNSSLDPERLVEKIKAICKKALSYIALLAASVLTFGIVTLIPCYFQYKKITSIEESLSEQANDVNFKWSKRLYENRNNDPKEFRCNLEHPELLDIEEMDQFLQKAKDLVTSEALNDWGNVAKQSEIPVSTHRWLVYLIVRNAGLDYACDQFTASLHLNTFLKVGRSEACQIQKDEDGKVHRKIVNVDEWSPKDLSELPNGVDPISLKYLIHHIEQDPQALQYFETILISDALDNNDTRLEDTKRWLNQNKSKASYIRNAAFLVDEISRALESRYPDIMQPRNHIDNSNSKQLGIDFEEYVDYEPSTPISFEKIRSVALDALKLFGIVIASIVSVGLVPFGVFIYQDFKIRGLINSSVSHRQPNELTSSYRAPKYQKSDQDPVDKAIDADGLNDLLKLVDSDHKIDNINSLQPLMEGAFIHAFNELLDISEYEDLGVVFTKSPKINDMQRVANTWVETYVNNKNALYNWITYLLIPKGNVRFCQDTNEFRLFFSDELSVGFSHSCSIPFRNQDRVVDFFLNEDEWSVMGKTDRSGVDPTGVYWILEKLESYPAGKEALETLLLSSLIPNDEESLSTAKQLVSVNSEEAELVRCAYELISDIGRSLGSIYKNPFYLRWEELADDNDAEDPLSKEEGCIDINELGGYVDWVPALSASPDFPAYSLAQTQSVITPIWKDIHKYRIEKSVTSIETIPIDEIRARDLLAEQYYWIHVNLDDEVDETGAGCLLSALCIYIYQATRSLENITPREMRNAFSDYLITLLNAMENNPSAVDRENYEYFKNEIEQSTKLRGHNIGWSIREYANWLGSGTQPRGKSILGHFDMGQLEIDLFCRVFGIGVQVFRTGDQYRLEQGLMLPIRSYGPRTREQVILFNPTGRTGQGWSFYLLMPKLRDAITSGPPDQCDSLEVQSALIHNRMFWGVNHMKDWGHRIVAPSW